MRWKTRMGEVPKFLVYGEKDQKIAETIQPNLGLRDWSELETEEKETALQQLKNGHWLKRNSEKTLDTIGYLNNKYLRLCPGKQLHKITPEYTSYGGLANLAELTQAAYEDFGIIFLKESSSALVLTMLSRFAQSQIDGRKHDAAKKTKGKIRAGLVEDAFNKFDRFAKMLNHIFDQFSVNMKLTRSGLIPIQDEKITESIYEPTLQILADPKWKSVNESLKEVFEEFTNGNYPEVITKAHSAVHSFLQIVVGEEGKNAKGEVRNLFGEAKRKGLIPVDRFSGPIIDDLQRFIVSERATNSTAKPTLTDATPSEALLVMNVVMVLLQHCLTNLGTRDVMAKKAAKPRLRKKAAAKPALATADPAPAAEPGSEDSNDT